MKRFLTKKIEAPRFEIRPWQGPSVGWGDGRILWKGRPRLEQGVVVVGNETLKAKARTYLSCPALPAGLAFPDQPGAV